MKYQSTIISETIKYKINNNIPERKNKDNHGSYTYHTGALSHEPQKPDWTDNPLLQPPHTVSNILDVRIVFPWGRGDRITINISWYVFRYLRNSLCRGYAPLPYPRITISVKAWYTNMYTMSMYPNHTPPSPHSTSQYIDWQIYAINCNKTPRGVIVNTNPIDKLWIRASNTYRKRIGWW